MRRIVTEVVAMDVVEDWNNRVVKKQQELLQKFVRHDSMA